MPSHHRGIGQQEGKERVLTKTRSSVTNSISDALVMKSDGLFFLCQRNGLVPDEKGSGHGLYYQDTRYVSVYTFNLGDTHLHMLASSDEDGDSIRHLLTNADLKDDNGNLVSKESVSVSLERKLDGDERTLTDAFRFDNYTLEAIDVTFSLTLEPDFASVFDVRGMIGQNRSPSPEASSCGDGVTYTYHGKDKRTRKLNVRFDPNPAHRDEQQACFQLHLEPRGSVSLNVTLEVDDEDGSPKPKATGAGHRTSSDRDAYVRDLTVVRSSSDDAERILSACFRDLRMLQTRIDGEKFFAAGVPWFVTIFGRDTLTTSLQTLAYNPMIAEQTLLLLAEYQGEKVDQWTEEQPGKILHELRRDELTNIGELPYRPYYGTVDATVLFVLLCARHAQWRGRLDLFEKLRGNIDAALRWIDEYADSDGDGYLDYNEDLATGLINEGWKDSSDAMVTAGGDLATPPIAPAEVQGYVYMAKREIAGLYERAGDKETAARLRKESDDLKQRFNRDYWLEDKGIFAMALAKDMNPLAVVSSNAGQVLWTGIADEDKARSTADRLMQDDMFTGWGIRTLSSQEKRYSPVSYHLGSVWPHDNAMIFGGLLSLHREHSIRIFQSMLEAARFFANSRLPELFCGFERDQYPRPVHYPVACHPQAWATGSVPYMLQQSLGLKPDGFSHRLVVDRPHLPAFIPDVELEHLKVGDGECHLRFERSSDGRAQVNVVSSAGLDIV
jgi:glycogen debranching enzyme